MFGDRIHRATRIMALLMFAAAFGVAIQGGIALASRFMPRVDVIEVRTSHVAAEVADAMLIAPRPATPGRYHY
ncbi:hypothetical protein [Salinicola aestuarinus]|uniref:hypothetical protein n=1 Tax=Salinicola aestuarinus TaxID=1949082 RepID=UPI000DA117FF|nr:hypothetical protein [Salinicola aestuarinus]